MRGIRCRAGLGLDGDVVMAVENDRSDPTFPLLDCQDFSTSQKVSAKYPLPPVMSRTQHSTARLDPSSTLSSRDPSNRQHDTCKHIQSRPHLVWRAEMLR
jgi:hypothetical protein